jgi:hypothetical protein
VGGACQATDELAEAASNSFGQHPDAEIIGSFPGLGEVAAARPGEMPDMLVD